MILSETIAKPTGSAKHADRLGPTACGRAMLGRMIIGRIIGWLFLLAGLSALVRDALVCIDTGRWLPLGLGEGWSQLGPAGYDGFIALGLPLAGYMLALWAFAVLIGLGLILLRLFRRPPPPPFPVESPTFLKLQ